MFQDVSNENDYPQLDPGTYLVECVGLEDGGEQEYGATIRWTFKVATLDGQPILDYDGNQYEETPLSGTKMTPGAKARRWSEALLGRELQDGESGADIARQLPGKRAVANVERVVSKGTGTARNRIVGLSPFRAGGGQNQQLRRPGPAPRQVTAEEALSAG